MNPFKALVDLIIPPVCHICGETLMEGEEFVCLGCASDLPRTYFHKYWKPATAPNSDLNPIEERFAGLVPLERATSLLFYGNGSSTATLVQDLKYRHFPGVGRVLGGMAASELSTTDFFASVDIILPVPLHWRKHLRRGYNQCRHIARGVADHTGIRVGNHLVAVKGHRTQTSLDRVQRELNTRGVYGVKRREELNGLHILLIDDICTTGATLLSAAKAITNACDDVRFSILTIGFAGMQ